MDEHERRRPTPIRTCVGCRRRAEKSELLRVVADEGTLAPDSHHNRPGRGAYLHRDPRCLDLAERRRALSRALRLPGGLDHTAVAAAIAAATTGSGTAPPARPARQELSGRDTEAG